MGTNTLQDSPAAEVIMYMPVVFIAPVLEKGRFLSESR